MRQRIRVRSLPRGLVAATSQVCRILRGRVRVSRGLKSAWFELTISPLSQARPLGGLHRAAPLPFRSSYFTAGLHPPMATLQRLEACLYRLRSEGPKPFAPSILAPRGAQSSRAPGLALTLQIDSAACNRRSVPRGSSYTGEARLTGDTSCNNHHALALLQAYSCGLSLSVRRWLALT